MGDIGHPHCPSLFKVEALPIKDAYILHNVCTADECKQFIAISEEMGYEASPLRNLDTLNSDQFAYNNTVRLTHY